MKYVTVWIKQLATYIKERRDDFYARASAIGYVGRFVMQLIIMN